MYDANIRQAEIDDFDSINNMFFEGTGRMLLKEKIENSIKNYSAFIIKDKENLYGFIYTLKFAPDILSITNIYIKEGFRNNGYGASLLNAMEYDAFNKGYNTIILYNSDLHENKEGKLNPLNFYHNNGYKLAFETKNTRVFYKSLNLKK